MPVTALITLPAAAPELPSAYLAADEQFDQLVACLRASQTQHMTHSQLEQLLETDGRELLRCLLQAHLDERAPATATQPVRDVAGEAHTHQRMQTRELESVFGTVHLTRIGYGGRALQSLHPLDAELNLPAERYSHTVRRRAAQLAAAQSFAEVLATLSEQTGAHVPKRPSADLLRDVFHRPSEQTGAHIPKRQVEELVTRAATDFDAYYQQQRAATAPESRTTGEILVLSSDGKGVPMRKADLRELTRQAAEARQPRLAHRREPWRKAPHQTHRDGRRPLYYRALCRHAGRGCHRTATQRCTAASHRPAPGR